MKQDLLLLIEKIYAAGLDPTLWQDCIDGINGLLNGRVGFLYSFNVSTNETTDVFLSSDHDPVWLQKYLNHYVELNPYPKPIHELAPAGIPLFDEEILPRDVARETEYYKGWMKPQGLDVAQIGCKIVIDDHRFVALGTHIEPETLEDRAQDYHALLTILIPHITRAVKINQVIRTEELIQNNLHGIFDQLDLAILLLDQKHRVQSANELAQKLLADADVITIDPHGGVLIAAASTSQQQFSTALQNCTRKDADPIQQTLCLNSTIDGGRYVTWTQMASQTHLDQIEFDVASFNPIDDNPLIAVLISLPQSHKGPPLEIVQTILGVTTAEAKLAAALANGETLKSYAEQAQISHNTARGQLSSVFHKTGMSRQAELVAHIWRSYGALRLS